MPTRRFRVMFRKTPGVLVPWRDIEAFNEQQATILARAERQAQGLPADVLDVQHLT